jgi:surface antigen
LSASQASNVKLTQKILLKLRKIRISKSHLPTFRSFTVYASIFTIFISAIGYSYQFPADKNVNSTITTEVNATREDSSVDDATALQVAGNIALRADLPIAANIANRSTSLFINNMISQDNAAVISKPQIFKSTTDNRLVKSYVVDNDDTLQSVADQFAISEQTIKWANALSTDTIEVGTALSIPPVDGVLYTIKESDTVEAIAEKYKADVKQVIAFNDLELSGIKLDQQIMLPRGELPIEERPEYVAPVQKITPSTPTAIASQSISSPLINGYSPITMTAAGNAYAFGNCTSWAYERRVQLGHPVGSYWGNGATWDSSARAAGYIVDKNPTAGSVYQMPAFVDAYTGGYGHVGIVESVNPDGGVNVSEMNYAGNFNVVTYRTIPAAQAALYNYIH